MLPRNVRSSVKLASAISIITGMFSLPIFSINSPVCKLCCTIWKAVLFVVTFQAMLQLILWAIWASYNSVPSRCRNPDCWVGILDALIVPSSTSLLLLYVTGHLQLFSCCVEFQAWDWVCTHGIQFSELSLAFLQQYEYFQLTVIFYWPCTRSSWLVVLFCVCLVQVALQLSCFGFILQLSWSRGSASWSKAVFGEWVYVEMIVVNGRMGTGWRL